MKVNARMKDLLYSTRGATVLFDISNYQHQQYLLELEQDVDYTLEIKKVKSKRSLEQNALLWKLLHMLEIKSRETAMDWYIKALIETGAKVDYVWSTEKAEDSLKKQDCSCNILMVAQPTHQQPYRRQNG